MIPREIWDDAKKIGYDLIAFDAYVHGRLKGRAESWSDDDMLQLYKDTINDSHPLTDKQNFEQWLEEYKRLKGK